MHVQKLTRRQSVAMYSVPNHVSLSFVPHVFRYLLLQYLDRTCSLIFFFFFFFLWLNYKFVCLEFGSFNFKTNKTLYNTWGRERLVMKVLSNHNN